MSSFTQFHFAQDDKKVQDDSVYPFLGLWCLGDSMNILVYLQPLAPMLSAMLAAVIVDIVLRLVPQARDRMDPLLGIPARLAAALSRKLNRSERPKHVRFSRGIITLMVVMGMGIAFGAVLEGVARLVPVMTSVIWFLCLRLTFPWHAGHELLQLWKHETPGKLSESAEILRRRRVPVLVPTTNPDRHALARMLIESTACALHRGWLGAVFWGGISALLDAPVILVVVLVTFLLEAERVIVTQNTKGSAFVAAFELIEAILNFIPARVAALFWALGAFFTPGANPLAAIHTMFTQSAAHRAVNSGWPVAAVAGALNIALPGGKKRDLWVGTKNATAKAGARDIQKALWLHGVTLGLTILIFTALLLLSIAA